jgi:hypothetical protein
MKFSSVQALGLQMFLLAAAASVSSVAYAAEPAPGGACAAVIASPANGDTVAQSGAVSGQASIPEGRYLWVFAHPKGFDGWWPQGGAAAATGDGSWRTTVFYGSTQDVGATFEVMAVPVDGKTNDTLLQWNANANAKHDFTPIRPPRPASGCQAAKLTVRRTS